MRVLNNVACTRKFSPLSRTSVSSVGGFNAAHNCSDVHCELVPVNGVLKELACRQWFLAAFLLYLAELPKRLRLVVFLTMPGHSGVVVRRCVLLASLKLCKTFQPPRCESGSAAIEAAVDVLLDTLVRPAGKRAVYHM